MRTYIKTISLCLLAFQMLSLSAFAASWPESDGQAVNPFEDEGLFASSQTTLEDSDVSEMSVTDQGLAGVETTTTLEAQNVPLFDASFQSGSTQYTDTSSYLPDVSMDDVYEWSQRKTNEVIHVLQTVVQPICIVSFIVSAFMLLFGTIASSPWAGRGFFGMIMACVIYAAVMFAPFIIPTFTAWVAS